MEKTSEVTIKVNIEGLETVTAGFEEIGSSAEAMGNNVSAVSGGMETNYANLVTSTENLGVATSNMASSVSTSVNQMDVSYGELSVTMEEVTASGKELQTNYRYLMMGTAGLVSNSVQLGDIMDRMMKGQLDLGRGALLLGTNFLQEASYLYMLNTKYGEKIATQALSIAGDVREAASNLGSAIYERITAFAGLIAKYGAKIAIQISSIAGDALDAAGNLANAAAKGVHAAASWALTAAEHARAIAHAIANALAGPVGWAILAGAVAAAAIGIGLANTIPSKQYGGLVEETRPYLLHKEEYVESVEERRNITEILSKVGVIASPAGHTTIVGPIYIENPVFRGKGDMDYLVDRLKRMGKA